MDRYRRSEKERIRQSGCVGFFYAYGVKPGFICCRLYEHHKAKMFHRVICSLIRAFPDCYGKQRPGWYFAHAQVDLSQRILRMFEGTFSPDTTQLLCETHFMPVAKMLKRQLQLQQTTFWNVLFFIFQRKQGLIFRVNRLSSRQFIRNVKSIFSEKEKKKKKKKECCLLQFCLTPG